MGQFRCMKCNSEIQHWFWNIIGLLQACASAGPAGYPFKNYLDSVIPFYRLAVCCPDNGGHSVNNP